MHELLQIVVIHNSSAINESDYDLRIYLAKYCGISQYPNNVLLYKGHKYNHMLYG